MDATVLDEWLFLIYFVYGLAFFGMGMAMALESGRSPALAEARVLRPLAAFGVIHGAHEWFESYLMQAESIPEPLPDWIPWLRVGTLAVSFPCLLLFAYNSIQLGPLQTTQKGVRGTHILGVYWLLVIFMVLAIYRAHSSGGVVLWDTMARYFLAVPASLLATLALSARGYQARAESRPELARFFMFAAVGFGVYAVTQVFVHPLDMFPANVINEGTFTYYTGIPIQLVRTVVAVLITYSLIRATQAVEQERHTELFAAQQARLEAMQQREELRRKLLQHTVQAQEEERARIARELHDETAQLLSAFSLELAALGKTLTRRREAREKVQNLLDLSRDVSQGLYRLMRDLRPAQLDDLGLIPALDYLVTRVETTDGIHIELSVEGEARRLELPIETILFRVAQEAISNIVRHARTRNADVELCFEQNQIQLRVADQGQGFDPDGFFSGPRGWGLEGMRERVETAGGKFTLNSAPGQGTTVTAVIPLEGPPLDTDSTVPSAVPLEEAR